MKTTLLVSILVMLFLRCEAQTDTLSDGSTISHHLRATLRAAGSNINIGGTLVGVGAVGLGLGFYFMTEEATTDQEAKDNKMNARACGLAGAGLMLIGGFVIFDGGTILNRRMKLKASGNGLAVQVKF